MEALRVIPNLRLLASAAGGTRDRTERSAAGTAAIACQLGGCAQDWPIHSRRVWPPGRRRYARGVCSLCQQKRYSRRKFGMIHVRGVSAGTGRQPIEACAEHNGKNSPERCGTEGSAGRQSMLYLPVTRDLAAQEALFYG